MNRKLTPNMLRTIVLEEMQKLREEKMTSVEDAAKKTKKVEADGYANTLEKHIDMLAALKIKETELRTALKTLDEQKKKLIKKISG